MVGSTNLSPTIQASVNFRNFAELYRPNLSMTKVEKTMKRSICVSFCVFYRFRVDLGPFHDVSFQRLLRIGPPDLSLNPTNDSTTTTLTLFGGGGEGNSIVFHVSFLTHSACQYDVT